MNDDRDAAQKKRDYERDAYHVRKERDAAIAEAMKEPTQQPVINCLRCGQPMRTCVRMWTPPGKTEPEVCNAPLCENCDLCRRGHRMSDEERAERDARRALLPDPNDETHEFPVGTLPKDKFGWVMIDTRDGLVRVRATQEFPEGYDALSEQEKAAVKRGEPVHVKRRCHVTGCGRKVALCAHPVIGSDGKERECGLSSCYVHGCREGHSGRSRAQSKSMKSPEDRPKPTKKQRLEPMNAKGEVTDEFILEVRDAWENGRLSDKEIIQKFGITAQRLAQWQALRRPNGQPWEKYVQGMKVEVMRDRPPDFYQWLKDVEFKILSEEEGQEGWIQFEPWPAQRNIIDDRLNRVGFVASKSRRIGATTCIQIADLYSWMWRQGPAYIHWVSQDLFQAQARLEEARGMLEQAKIPDWQRECFELGGKTATEIIFKTRTRRNTINVHAPTEKAARGLRGTDLLMDEAAWMPYQELIYTTFVGNLSDQKFSLAIVSSANAEDVWFQEILDHAEDRGLKAYLLDYRARPGRDEEWFEQQVARLGGDRDSAEQEFMGKAKKKVALAFDVHMIQRKSKEVQWVGEEPVPGRVYTHGIDQSGVGKALTVDVIMDVTDVPAQVIAIRPFEYDEEAAIRGKGRSQQKSEWADSLAMRWPGNVFVDCTSDQATVEYMQWPGKVMVRFRQMQDPKEAPVGGIRALRYPRLAMFEEAIKFCEMGRVVIHDQFQELYEALRTAPRYGEVEKNDLATGRTFGGRTKRSGKRAGRNVDILDGFLLSCLGLTELGGGGNTGVRGQVTGRQRGTPAKVWKPPQRRYW